MSPSPRVCCLPPRCYRRLGRQQHRRHTWTIQQHTRSLGLDELRSESRGNPIPEGSRMIQLDLDELLQYVIEMVQPFRGNYQLLHGLLLRQSALEIV